MHADCIRDRTDPVTCFRTCCNDIAANSRHGLHRGCLWAGRMCSCPLSRGEDHAAGGTHDIIDDQGAPIEGADVTLIAYANPVIGEQGRNTKSTASNGMAEFSSEHDLRVEVLAIHGADFYN